MRRLVLIALLLAAAGCPNNPATTQPAADAPAPKPPPPHNSVAVTEPRDDEPGEVATPGTTHLVQSKETLYSLAQRYYGNPNQWRKIYYANRNRIRDPNNLPVGIRLIIPPP